MKQIRMCGTEKKNHLHETEESIVWHATRGNTILQGSSIKIGRMRIYFEPIRLLFSEQGYRWSPMHNNMARGRSKDITRRSWCSDRYNQEAQWYIRRTAGTYSYERQSSRISCIVVKKFYFTCFILFQTNTRFTNFLEWHLITMKKER